MFTLMYFGYELLNNSVDDSFKNALAFGWTITNWSLGVWGVIWMLSALVAISTDEDDRKEWFIKFLSGSFVHCLFSFPATYIALNLFQKFGLSDPTIVVVASLLYFNGFFFKYEVPKDK